MRANVTNYEEGKPSIASNYCLGCLLFLSILYGVATGCSMVLIAYLLPLAATFWAVAESEVLEKSRKNSFLYLSTNLIPALIVGLTLPLMNWQELSPYGIDREFATNIFQILFFVQCLWIFIFPLLIKGNKWPAVLVIFAFIPTHLVSGFLAIMAISRSWL